MNPPESTTPPVLTDESAEVEKIKADGTDATIALLKNRVNWLIEVIANNFHILAGVGTPPAPIA